MSLLPSPLSTWQKALQQETASTATAVQIIEEYFSFFGPQAAKEELWRLTAATLSNEEVEQSNNPKFRADIIFYCEFTKLLIDAVHLLHSSGEK